MQRLWSLAAPAHERRQGMAGEDRAALLSLLAVRVTLKGASECLRCDGRGKLNGRRGGYRCDRCPGLRKLADVRIEGEVVEDLAPCSSPTDGRGILFSCRPRSHTAEKGCPKAVWGVVR